MKKKKNNKMFSKNTNIILSAISYTIIILLISILLVSVFTPIHKPFLKTQTQITNDEKISSFLINGNVEVFPQGITENEINHMKDVRKLLAYALGILIIIIRIFIYTIRNKSFNRKIRWYYESKKKEKLTKEEIGVVLISPLIILKYLSIIQLITSNKFGEIFLTFHKILFPQGNFAFPMNSVLIQTYPEIFFQNIFLSAIVLFASLSCLVLIIFFTNHLLKKKKREKTKE